MKRFSCQPALTAVFVLLSLFISCIEGEVTEEDFETTQEEVEVSSQPEVFTTVFGIEENGFEIADPRTGEVVSEFAIDGEFALDFTSCDIGYCAQVASFNEVISGVSLEQINLLIDSLPLTEDFLDLDRSRGTYDPGTGNFTMQVIIDSIPDPRLDSMLPYISFEERGNFNLDAGQWNVAGQANLMLGGLPILASTKTKGGKAHPGKKSIVAGLASVFRAWRGDANIAIDAKSCKCGPSCKLAAKQLVGTWNVKDMVLGVANAVFDGTLKAINPTTKLGKLAKKILKGMKDELVKNDVALSKTGVEVKLARISGINVNKDCSMDYAITYKQSTRKVSAVFMCNCGGKSCIVRVSYTAKSNGWPKGRAKIKVTR